MTELIIYAAIFLLLIAHTVMAGSMYMKVHQNKSLSLEEKNLWKLRALIFPAYYYTLYRKATPPSKDV
ncbi:hypothetical protein EL17_19240 [Anditalea andensis]|uniref:Uncharacterized protein n=1 Tax=Anditalea andensis TaxID=1048983 RepID=A0A074KUW9_9BACT|nr:hypothetical protein EL17_19240 [Anditalea andensis]